jgi:hypothetical protein
MKGIVVAVVLFPLAAQATGLAGLTARVEAANSGPEFSFTFDHLYSATTLWGRQRAPIHQGRALTATDAVLGAGYQFGAWGFEVLAPWRRFSVQGETGASGVRERAGVGDLSALGRYRLQLGDFRKPGHVEAAAGFWLPTGDAAPGGGWPEGAIGQQERAIQPGTGVLGLIAQVNARYPLGAFGLTGDAQYRLGLGADRTGYRPGDALELSAGAQFEGIRGFGLGLRGRLAWQRPDDLAGKPAENSGAFVVALTPLAEINVGAVFVQARVDVPVFRAVEGSQIAPDVRVSLGAGFRWGYSAEQDTARGLVALVEEQRLLREHIDRYPLISMGSPAEPKDFQTQGLVAVLAFVGPACQLCPRVRPALDQVADRHPDVRISRVEAPLESTISMQYLIPSLPTVVVFNPDGTIADVVPGAEALAIEAAVASAKHREKAAATTHVPPAPVTPDEAPAGTQAPEKAPPQ